MVKLANALSVFNHLITNGVKEKNIFKLGELQAWYDFDGYSCYIKYRDLQLSIYFHSKFDCSYKKQKTFEDFLLIIDKYAETLIKVK